MKSTKYWYICIKIYNELHTAHLESLAGEGQSSGEKGEAVSLGLFAVARLLMAVIPQAVRS